MSQALLPLQAVVGQDPLAPSVTTNARMIVKTTASQSWDIEHVSVNYAGAPAGAKVNMFLNNHLVHDFDLAPGTANAGVDSVHLQRPIRLWPNDELQIRFQLGTATDIVFATVLYDDGQDRPGNRLSSPLRVYR